MTRDDLLAALTHDNVQAFLRVIRQGESSQDDNAYRTIFGGKLFDVPPWEHPNELVRLNGLQSTAAGAYQFLARTWYSLVKQYGFPDFSPSSQDQAAVALIAGRGALDDVIAGRLDAAILKCAKEWASLPGSLYGQPTQTLKDCREIFAAYGGREAPSSPVSQPDGPSSSQKVDQSSYKVAQEVKPMPAILAALLPTILQSIPQLISVFGSGNDSEVAKRNQAAGVIVADTLVKATNAVNLEDAVTKIQSDPQALAAAHDAVNDLLPRLVEAGGGGIDGARKASADPSQLPFYKQPAFVFLVAATPLVYMLAVSVLFGVGGGTWSDDAKMMVATGILGVLTGGGAYFWGSSVGSSKKTDALVAK